MSDEKEKQQALELAAAIKDGALTREQVETALQGAENEEARRQLLYLIDDDAILAARIIEQKIQSGYRSTSTFERAISTLDVMARNAIAKRIAEEAGGTYEEKDVSYNGQYVRLTQGETSVTAEVKFIKVDDYKARDSRRIQVNVDSIRYGIRDQIFRDTKKGLDFAAIAKALKEQLEARINRDEAYTEKQKQAEEMRAFIADLKGRFDTDGFDVDYTDRFGVEAKLTFTTKDKAAFEALIAKLMPAKKQEAVTA